jgi:uncharacterized membrane protein
VIEPLPVATLVAATVATGLLAGLFWSFTVAVMPGLRQVDDRAFVATMQRINVSIVNPVFLLVFLASPILTLAAALFQLGAADRAALPWAVAGFVLATATIVITFGANIPLNNALDAAGPPEQVGDLAAVRERFEARWVRLNNVRTLTSTAAFACLCWALVLYGRVSAS